MLVSSVADLVSEIEELNSFSIPKPRDYPGPNIRYARDRVNACKQCCGSGSGVRDR